MKQFFIIILFSISIFANEVVTKDDISEIKRDIRESNRVILEVMNKRFEDMQKYMDKRFEDMQKSTDKRFETVDKRFEDMNSKFNMIVTIMLTGFTLIMGYLIKERNSIKKDVKEEIDKELEVKLTQKADINLVERVVNVLEEFGRRNGDIANVLKKHNFIVK